MTEESGSSEDDHVDDLAALHSQTTSPLAGRSKSLAKDIRVKVPTGPGHSASQTVTKKVERTSSPLAEDGEEGSDETEDEGEDEGSDIAKTESDDWLPASSRLLSTTAIPQNGPLPYLQQAPSPVFERDVKAGRAHARRSNKTSVSELAHDLGELNLAASENPHQPAARPTRTRQSNTVPTTEENGDDDSIIVVQNAKGGEGQKKKKR